MQPIGGTIFCLAIARLKSGGTAPRRNGGVQGTPDWASLPVSGQSAGGLGGANRRRLFGGPEARRPVAAGLVGGEPACDTGD